MAPPGSMIYLAEDSLSGKLASIQANHELIREIMYQNHPDQEFTRFTRKKYQSSPLLVAYNKH